jgi:hypothetical protein
MELTTAMLADSARVAEGKLYVHGGQWTNLWTQAFPASHPALAVVIVLRVDYHEAIDSHELNVALMMDGVFLGVGAGVQLQIGRAPSTAPGAPTFVPMALPFYNVPLQGPGRYEWVVSVDGNDLGSIPMEVTLQPEAGAAPN